MSINLSIPREYGYVLGVATLSTFVASWHSMNTGRFRRKAQVPYPNAYSTHAEATENKDKYLFNCAQRAHANFVEHQPQWLIGLLVGGLRYPVISASLGAAWNVCRVAYTVGYCRRDKEQGRGRLLGGEASYAIELVMLIMSGMTGYKMLME